MASETPTSGLQFSRKPKKFNILTTQSSLRSHPERKDSLSTRLNFQDEASTNSKHTSSSKVVKSPSFRQQSKENGGTGSSKSRNMKSKRKDLKPKYSLGSPSKGHQGERKQSKSVHRSSSRSSERGRELVGVAKKERKWSHRVEEEWMGRLEDEFACEYEMMEDVLSERELGRLKKMHEVQAQFLRQQLTQRK